jgi:hypothetical protein
MGSATNEKYLDGFGDLSKRAANDEESVSTEACG